MPSVAASPPGYHYTKNPEAIYALSFARIAEAVPQLADLPPPICEILARIIHAAADPSIFASLAYTPDIAEASMAALAGGADILCDSRMLAAGINRRLLPKNKIITMLDHPDAPATASRLATTRSAAGVIAHRDQLGGAVLAIGNAPTALFAVLEGLAAGWSPPTAIFAFPLGFVGADEAKSALINARLATPYMTLAGRRGGSGMAAAAINAVAMRAKDTP